jgi:diaminohydroxyphosphoribosylaminopyrimidine deaminase/5-amino-6-(5-phosphoribosylamino)uracil reductase
MQLASELAKKGQGKTWTNPLVGAVIVKNQEILACGFHHQFGKPHAEIEALNQLTELTAARGATMYVTLEPCSHYGKTPPCAKKLVEVGLARVIIGQLDPNPLVAGKGCQILRQAGIKVEILNQTQQLNPNYNFYYCHQRPWITLKYAMSFDGKINAESGVRSILTGQKAFLDTQQLRAKQQAILIGENTLKVDDPQLTVRLADLLYPPVRVVLVNDADQLNLNLRLFKSTAPILLLSRKKSKREWPPQVTVLTDDEWSSQKVIQLLYQRGIQSLLIEGGAQIQADYLGAGIVDRLVIYLTPHIFGGIGLPAVFGKVTPNFVNYRVINQQQIGEDFRFELVRTKEESNV